MEKKVLSFMKKNTMCVSFAKHGDHMLHNLCDIGKIPQLTVKASLTEEGIVFSGKVLDHMEVPIKFSSLEKIEITAYSRVLRSIGTSMLVSMFFVCIKLTTKKGFECNFESRDYESLKQFIKGCENAGVAIEDFQSGLSKLIMVETEEHIDAFLKENWKEIAEKNNLVQVRAEYTEI